MRVSGGPWGVLLAFSLFVCHWGQRGEGMGVLVPSNIDRIVRAVMSLDRGPQKNTLSS